MAPHLHVLSQLGSIIWGKDGAPGWSRRFIIAIGNAGVCAAPTDPGGGVQVVMKEELCSCPSPATFTSLAGKRAI